MSIKLFFQLNNLPSEESLGMVDEDTSVEDDICREIDAALPGQDPHGYLKHDKWGGVISSYCGTTVRELWARENSNFDLQKIKHQLMQTFGARIKINKVDDTTLESEVNADPKALDYV